MQVEAPTPQKYDKLAMAMPAGAIIATTYMQKFALPVPLGSLDQLLMSFVMLMGVTGVGFITHRLVIHPRRFAAYLTMIAIILLTQLLGGADFSMPSMLLLAIIHIPYVFTLKAGQTPPGAEMLFFQKTMLALAILGILQYVLQFVIGPDYAFLLDSGIFPTDFVAASMNNMNSIGYQATVYKSNGLFLIEPSIFCQFLAIALVIEITYFKNLKRSLAYLAAIIVTFSGTGLIILFTLIPVYLVHHKRFVILTMLMLTLFTAPVWGPIIGLEYTVNRAAEFSDHKSSAYARFISSIPQIEIYVLPSTQHTFFGMGAGSMYAKDTGRSFDFEAALSTWGKVFFEYGLIGFIAYFGFIGYVFALARRSNYLKAALLIQYLILGEYLLPAFVHPIIIALLVWPTEDKKQPLEPKKESIL